MHWTVCVALIRGKGARRRQPYRAAQFSITRIKFHDGVAGETASADCFSLPHARENVLEPVSSGSKRSTRTSPPHSRAVADRPKHCRRRDNGNCAHWRVDRGCWGRQPRSRPSQAQQAPSGEFQCGWLGARSERSRQAPDFRRGATAFRPRQARPIATPQSGLRPGPCAKSRLPWLPLAPARLNHSKAIAMARILPSAGSISPSYRRARRRSATSRPCISRPACRPPQFPCGWRLPAAYWRGADLSLASRKTPPPACDSRR